MLDVSFGRVIAISGKSKKVTKVNKRLRNNASPSNLMIKDVTNIYKYAPSSGMMAQAAQNGDVIELCITGEDVQKIKNKEKGWNTVKKIAVNIENYFSVNRMNINDAVQKILFG